MSGAARLAEARIVDPDHGELREVLRVPFLDAGVEPQIEAVDVRYPRRLRGQRKTKTIRRVVMTHIMVRRSELV